MTTAFQSNAFQNNAYQIDDALPTGGGGRIRRFRQLDTRPRFESENDKLARRIREGTLPAPVIPQPIADTGPDYAKKSAQLAASIARFRSEAEASRKAIARLEAKALKRETDRIRHDLLIAQQALQLALVQEAVMLEEMEMLDVAFVASVALGMTLQ